MHIRRKILETWLANSTNTAVNGFVRSHLDDLVAGENEALMNTVRQYFSSNTDSLEVAWRAFDPFAPVKCTEEGVEEWPNLLTPKRGENALFTTRETRRGDTEASLSTASYRISMQAVYYFLLTQDKALGADQKSSLFQDFLFYVHAMRRSGNASEAHDRDNGGVDTPSCYPGHLSRMMHIGDRHPRFMGEQFDKRTLLEHAMSAHILDRATHFLETHPEICPMTFLDALLYLNTIQAPEVFWSREQMFMTGRETYDAELLSIRKQFVESRDGLHLARELDRERLYFELSERNQLIGSLSTLDRKWIDYQMVALTDVAIADRLTEICRQAYLSRAQATKPTSPEPEPSEVTLERAVQSTPGFIRQYAPDHDNLPSGERTEDSPDSPDVAEAQLRRSQSRV